MADPITIITTTTVEQLAARYRALLDQPLSDERTARMQDIECSVPWAARDDFWDLVTPGWDRRREY